MYSCNPALHLQSTAPVVLYISFFFIQLFCILGGIWRYNMQKRIHTEMLFFRRDCGPLKRWMFSMSQVTCTGPAMWKACHESRAREQQCEKLAVWLPEGHRLNSRRDSVSCPMLVGCCMNIHDRAWNLPSSFFITTIKRVNGKFWFFKLITMYTIISNIHHQVVTVNLYYHSMHFFSSFSLAESPPRDLRIILPMRTKSFYCK